MVTIKFSAAFIISSSSWLLLFLLAGSFLHESSGFLVVHSSSSPPSLLFSSRTSKNNDYEEAAEESTSSYLATCIPGLAHILAEELREIHPDISDVQLSRNAAVTFTATREASLAALCWVRTAHRILELVSTTTTTALYDRDDLHAFISEEIDVKSLLGDGHGGLLSLSVKTILNNPRELPKDLSHSHYTALTIKNALCDVVRELRGDRPNVDIDDPDVPLVAMLLGTEGGAAFSLYRSLHSPGSLHKRGYRQGGTIHKASMKESLAAGLLREAGFHQRLEYVKTNENAKLRLIDPMAGSGSFLLEAAMMATDIAPGLMRIRCNVPYQSLPPVTRWKNSQDGIENTTKIWKQILLDASQRAKNGLQWIRQNPTKLHMLANDIHSGALDIFDESLYKAGFQNLIEISNMDCYDLDIMTESDGEEEEEHEDDDDEEEDDDVHVLVVTNPPWGVRLTEDIEDSWEGLKHFIRNKCPSGTEAWILSGHKGATQLLKLRRDRMIPIQTGDQTLRWIQYTIRNSGSRSESESAKVSSSPSSENTIKQKHIQKLKLTHKGKGEKKKQGSGGKSRQAVAKNEWLLD